MLCGSYYAVREYLSTGYLKKVIFSEYSRFTQNIMTWHEQPFWFYFKNMYERFYSYYIFFLPLTITGIFSKDKNIKQFSILGITFSVTYFLLISYPKVKLEWYDAPLYPILSLLLACTLYQTIDLILLGNKFKNSIIIFICLILFSFSYYKIYKQNLSFLTTESLEFDGYAIRELSRISPDIKRYKVLMPLKTIEHIDEANFYIKSLNHFEGFRIELIGNTQGLKPNDIVLCSQVDTIAKIEQQFKSEEISSVYKSKLLRIK